MKEVAGGGGTNGESWKAPLKANAAWAKVLEQNSVLMNCDAPRIEEELMSLKEADLCYTSVTLSLLNLVIPNVC